MINPMEIKLPRWPFFLGDAVLLAAAYFLYRHVRLPLTHWECGCFVTIAVLGAAFAVAPFLIEYRAAMRNVETGAMVSALSEIQNLQEVADYIKAATAQWHGVHEHSTSAINAARDIAGKMKGELDAFSETMKKASDSERSNMRLEIEKLRRTEGEWIQVAVRLLDHTYALYQAAVRSGQANVVEQISHFQSSCRDVARRVGLVPFIADADDPFDPKWHHCSDTQAALTGDVRVRDTIATGYTFQGQMIRPALVSLQDPAVKDLGREPESLHAALEEKTPVEDLQERTLL